MVAEGEFEPPTFGCRDRASIRGCDQFWLHERRMRLIALAFVVMSLLSIAATACSDAAGNYYENDTHGGYPGPGTRTQNRDG
jgi:hypothetical protein